MQKIKIANIEVTEGDNDKGHWSKYLIIGDDKTRVSSFDKGAASLKVGDTIEAEVEVKGKFTNLKSFKVVGHATEGKAPAPSTNGKELPPEYWEAKQRIERQSIEAQTAVKAILQHAEPVGEEAKRIYLKALLWCEAKIDANMPTKALQEQLGRMPHVAGPEKTEKKAPPLKDVGELYARAGKFGISPRDVLSAAGVDNPEDIIDLDEAWVATAKRFKATIKAAQEAGK